MTELANPYVGPRPFQEGERIYGRDRELDELLDQLIARRILLLHSPSGAGKSSLINAGLIPRLREEEFEVLPVVRVNSPPADGSTGNRFVQSAVSSLDGGDADAASVGLEECLQARLDGDDSPDSVFVLFDQFEEVLTFDALQPGPKEAFFDELGRALRDRRIWALFAIREDYLGPLANYQNRVPTGLGNRFRLDLLSRKGATQAIDGPARRTERRYADGVVEQLSRDLATMKVQQPDGSFVSETGPHVEPVQLQVVCRRLWADMPFDDLSIDLEDLEAFGDVDQALGDYYARAVERIADGDEARERAIRDWFDQELITEGGIRGQVVRGHGVSGGLANDAIAELRETHLVRAEERGGATWYELAHDRLLAPVRESNAAWLTAHLHPMQRQAVTWNRQGRPDSLLLGGRELGDAARWARGKDGALRPEERDLLSRSQSSQRSRRARNIAGAVALSLIVVAAVVAVLQMFEANKQTGLAKRQTELAEERSRQAEMISLMSASLAQEDPNLASLILAEFLERPELDEPPGGTQRAVDLAKATVERTALRHEGAVGSAEFSPDGNRVLTGAPGGVRMWRADGHGEPTLLELEPPGSVVTPAFSEDGNRILAWSGKTVRVWRGDGGLQTELEHPVRLVSAAFSPDGTQAVSSSWFQGPGRQNRWSVRVWDLDTGCELDSLECDDQVGGVAFSPDGSRVLMESGYESNPLIWSPGSDRTPLALDGSVRTAGAFSPDGARVVTATYNGGARIWSSDQRGEPLALDPDRGVVSAAFSPDGSRIIATNSAGTANVYEFEPGRDAWSAIAQLTGIGSGETFSPDGARILARAHREFNEAPDDTVRVLHFSRRGPRAIEVELKGHVNRVSTTGFSPDGTWVVTASMDGTARIWSTYGSDEPQAMEAGRYGGRVRRYESPKGSGAVCVEGWDGIATLWSADRAGEPHILPHLGKVTRAAFSDDGGRLVTASEDTTARVWNGDGSGEPVVLEGHRDWVFAVAFSHDGTRVITGSNDKTARIWNADGTGEPIVLDGHESLVVGVAFSRDGTRVVTADRSTVRIWRADTAGRPITQLDRAFGSTPWPAEFGPVAWSPDGTLVATLDGAGTARVYRADGVGEPLLLKSPPSVNGQRVEFSVDGARVVTLAREQYGWSSQEAIVQRTWRYRWHDLLTHLRARTTRCLTVEERTRILFEEPEQAIGKFQRCERKYQRSGCLFASERKKYLAEPEGDSKRRRDACLAAFAAANPSP